MKKVRLIFPLLLSLLSCSALSCAPPAAGQKPEVPQAAPVKVEPSRPLPELTSDEMLIAEDLRRHVNYLSGKVGERNEGAPWELADAADYIAGELEGMGMAVERQGYETRNVAAQNLAVTISGSERGDQVFLVGAHYDSPLGDKGQNAGGSATAALLSLLSLMKGASLKRTLRFVFLSMGESPHGDGEARGARHYARFVAGKSGSEIAPRGEDEMQVQKRAATVGVLLLDRLAVFEAGTLSAAPLEARVTVSQGGQVVRDLLLEDFDREVFVLAESELGGASADSDLRAFQEQGIPGITLQGTGADVEAVRYDELARVVMQIRRGIGRVSGERPKNDGMLTPLSRQVR